MFMGKLEGAGEMEYSVNRFLMEKIDFCFWIRFLIVFVKIVWRFLFSHEQIMIKYERDMNNEWILIKCWCEEYYEKLDSISDY